MFFFVQKFPKSIFLSPEISEKSDFGKSKKLGRNDTFWVGLPKYRPPVDPFVKNPEKSVKNGSKMGQNGPKKDNVATFMTVHFPR